MLPKCLSALISKTSGDTRNSKSLRRESRSIPTSTWPPPPRRWSDLELWFCGGRSCRLGEENVVWRDAHTILCLRKRFSLSWEAVSNNLYRSQGPPPNRTQVEWQPTRSRTLHLPERFGLLQLIEGAQQRPVSTAGILVSNFSPIASKFSHAAACDTADLCLHLRRNRSLCWTNEIKRYTEKQVESTDPAVTSEAEAFTPSQCRCFLVCL